MTTTSRAHLRLGGCNYVRLILLYATVLGTFACGDDDTAQEPFEIEFPVAFPDAPIPEDNVPTEPRSWSYLFYDKLLAEARFRGLVTSNRWRLPTVKHCHRLNERSPQPRLDVPCQYRLCSDPRLG